MQYYTNSRINAWAQCPQVIRSQCNGRIHVARRWRTENLLTHFAILHVEGLDGLAEGHEAHTEGNLVQVNDLESGLAQVCRGRGEYRKLRSVVKFEC